MPGWGVPATRARVGAGAVCPAFSIRGTGACPWPILICLLVWRFICSTINYHIRPVFEHTSCRDSVLNAYSYKMSGRRGPLPPLPVKRCRGKGRGRGPGAGWASKKQALMDHASACFSGVGGGGRNCTAVQRVQPEICYKLSPRFGGHAGSLRGRSDRAPACEVLGCPLQASGQPHPGLCRPASTTRGQVERTSPANYAAARAYSLLAVVALPIFTWLDPTACNLSTSLPVEPCHPHDKDWKAEP